MSMPASPRGPRWPLAPASRLGWLFLAGSLLLAGWVGVELAREQLRWRESTMVRFRTRDATGIWPGVNVTLSGYRIGRVTEVTLAGDGMVDVHLRIAAPYRRLIGPRSQASTAQEGLIGDTVIVLSPDITPPGQEVARVDLKVPFRAGSSPADLMKELAKTRLQLDRTLQSIAVVVEKDLPKAIGGFDGTLRDVRSLAGTVERETGSTAAVTRDTLRLYQETGRQMGETGRQVGATSAEATEVMKATSPVLVDTLRQIRDLSTNTNRLLKALGGTLLLGLPDPAEKPGEATTPPAPAAPPLPPPAAEEPAGPPRLPHRGSGGPR